MRATSVLRCLPGLLSCLALLPRVREPARAGEYFPLEEGNEWVYRRKWDLDHPDWFVIRVREGHGSRRHGTLSSTRAPSRSAKGAPAREHVAPSLVHGTLCTGP